MHAFSARPPAYLVLSYVALAACGKSESAAGDATPAPIPVATATYDNNTKSDTAGAQSVPVTGGTVYSDDNLATMIIPAGALGADTNIAVGVTALARLPGDTADLRSDGYNFQPDGTVLQNAVTITLVPDSPPTAGWRMVLACMTADGVWSPLGSSTYNDSAGTVSAEVTRLGCYAAMLVPDSGAGCAGWEGGNDFCAPQTCDTAASLCTVAPMPIVYAVGGSVVGLPPNSYVTVQTLDQSIAVVYPATDFAFSDVLVAGEGYDVSLGDATAGLDCQLTGGSGLVGETNVVVPVTCALNLHLATNQNASIVLGQPDFVTTTTNLPVENLYRLPIGAVYLADNGSLFVSDTDDDRLLAYYQIPGSDTAGANYVVGQNDFNSRVGWSQTQPSPKSVYPVSIAGDANHLVVADPYTNRVVIWSPIADADNPPVSTVLGQPDDVTGGNFSCSPNTFSTPSAVLVVSGHLLVSDRYNHRILIWNNIPDVDGLPADQVLGQPDLVTCNYPSAVSPNTLAQPLGMWTDGTRLMVADRDSSRVLMWNTFPTSNRQPADGFLGQPDFYSAGTNTDPTVGTNFPDSVASDGKNVFVTEPLRNRVTVWNGFPDADNPPALVAALGQDSLTDLACNQNAIAGPNTLCDPEGVAVVGAQLFVTDASNSRVLIYNSN